MHLPKRQMLVATLPGILASATLLLAALAGLAWPIGSGGTATLASGLPAMKLGTSSMLAALACALLITRNQDGYKQLAIVCALYAALLSLACLVFENQITHLAFFAPPPAPATSIALLLLSISVLLLLTAKRPVHTVAPLLLLAMLLPLYHLVTQLIGFGSMNVSGTFASMSVPTALGSLFLAVGLFLHPRLPFAARLVADSLQGRLLRATLPWVIPTPTLVAVLFAATIGGGGYDAEVVMVAVISCLTILMTYLLWELSHRLEQADQRRQTAERTLVVSEGLSKQIIEHSPIAKLVVNETGRIEHVNLRLEQMLGYDRKELVNQPVDMLVPERFRSGHGATMREYIASPKVRNMGEGRELFARRKDGSEVPVEIALAPLKTHKGTLILANIVDITARWKYQADIKAALHEKTLLLNEIHHRVKNNLQIVASLLSLQASRVGNPAFASLISESEGRVRAMALMHQVLYERKDFARVELDVYLHRLGDLASQIHGASRNKIVVHVQAEGLTLDLTRAIPLGLVVNELLSNVFKHAFPDKSGGEAWVELHALNGQAQLTVRDNGRGLPNNFSLDHARTLGMQIVHLLAEQIGATLSIRNEGGACFEILFSPSSNSAETEPTPVEQET